MHLIPMILALFATILGLACWLGAVVFATYFVFPVLFRKLTPGKAAEVNDHISLRYYYLGMACGGLMEMGGTLALLTAPKIWPTIIFMGLTALAMVGFMWGGIVMLPRAIDLRQRLQSTAGSEENFPIRERYDQIVRLSLFLNWVTVFILLGAALALASHLGLNTAKTP